MRRWTFFLSFFSGTAAGTMWRFDLALAGALVLAGIIFWFSHIFYYRSRSRVLFLATIFCFTFGLAAMRGTLSLGPVSRPLDVFVGEKVQLSGLISAEPDEREKTVRLTFTPDHSDEKIMLVAGKYPAHFYGERLVVRGKLDKPENFETDTGREFDYINYLAKDEVYYLINRPELESLGASGSWLVSARGQLFRFKNFFLTRLTSVLPEPHASLLGGIVIGAKRGLPDEWQDRFRVVGLSHVVVLSGYNITIVSEAVLKVFAFLPMLWGLAGGAGAILLFTLATGASTTAVRAAIMALVALLARATGRVYQSLDALFLAAFLMILIQPKVLLFDISFQLSFLATFGIIVGPPILQKYFQKVPERFGLREMTVTTISAQLFVLPWILYKLGQLSLVALPLNLLVLAFIPFTMLLGFLTFVFAPFAYLAYLFLAYDLWLVEIFAALPFAAVNISYFPLWLVALVYLAYFWFGYKKRARR
ncbi:ComEC/Rec2 family competence protein [Candidatus Nomurabacteria bacterium]|nr:ComEC/Rec2 family competence protein [Candidatus Nomurabacteria bacterium]